MVQNSFVRYTKSTLADNMQKKTLRVLSITLFRFVKDFLKTISMVFYIFLCCALLCVGLSKKIPKTNWSLWLFCDCEKHCMNFAIYCCPDSKTHQKDWVHFDVDGIWLILFQSDFLFIGMPACPVGSVCLGTVVLWADPRTFCLLCHSVSKHIRSPAGTVPPSRAANKHALSHVKRSDAQCKWKIFCAASTAFGFSFRYFSSKNSAKSFRQNQFESLFHSWNQSSFEERKSHASTLSVLWDTQSA